MRTVIINDVLVDRRSVVFFNEDDFDRIDTYWDQEDKILVDMQSVDLFKGRTRWKELAPIHYRVMLTQNLTLVSALTDEEQADPENIVVASLTFLLTGFIKCLETRSQSTIELFRVNRVGEFEVLFDYTAIINMGSGFPTKPQSGLRVIVDNT